MLIGLFNIMASYDAVINKCSKLNKHVRGALISSLMHFIVFSFP